MSDNATIDAGLIANVSEAIFRGAFIEHSDVILGWCVVCDTETERRHDMHAMTPSGLTFLGSVRACDNPLHPAGVR